MDVKTTMWILNVAVAILAAVNAIAWGYATREARDPQPILNFLFKLVFNKWFIIGMASAFIASILSYVVLREMGVLVGRFFLSLGTVATILACTFVLGEWPT
ncbi:hypothetical protein apy_12530 [Aeropyrum pernix]|uniref:Uncharacterized protein n=1 Tax=Aeropyrum pernix TaxID=56636 RepID=A0A401HAZ1_AERPX|nr:hypothetical protein [Aeropyrum pernix]GBF09528.1 hypothetical protein apy_12530 [Aeropyrum pernix]